MFGDDNVMTCVYIYIYLYLYLYLDLPYFCNPYEFGSSKIALLAKEVFCPQGSSNGAGQGESECVA